MISTTELKDQVQGFFVDGIELLRKEVQLARAEIDEKVTLIQHGILSLAAGAAIGFVGLIFLGHAAADYLATIFAPGTAMLIVAVFFIVLSIIMLATARAKLRAEELKPHRTMRAAKNVARELGGTSDA